MCPDLVVDLQEKKFPNANKSQSVVYSQISFSGDRRTSQTTSLDEIQESEEEKELATEISSETGAV